MSDLPDRTRDQYGRWLPGRSAHPGGRAKDHPILVKLAREHSEEALREIVRLMRNDPDSRIRLQAAAMILDRAYGRPAVAATLTVEDARDTRKSFFNPAVLNDDELRTVETLLTKASKDDGVACEACGVTHRGTCAAH